VGLIEKFSSQLAKTPENVENSIERVYKLKKKEWENKSKLFTLRRWAWLFRWRS